MVPMSEHVVIVDLDGTLCDTEHRHHLIHWDNEVMNWDAYSLACVNDPPIHATIRLVQHLAHTHRIVILSGRQDVALDATAQWLEAHEVPYDELHLRSQGDHRRNPQFKRDFVRRRLRNGERVAFAIDDHPGVAEALSEIGVPTILVAPNGRGVITPENTK